VREQVDQVCLKENHSEKFCEYCRIYMLWTPVDTRKKDPYNFQLYFVHASDNYVETDQHIT